MEGGLTSVQLTWIHAVELFVVAIKNLMNQEDEIELHRLCNAIKRLDTHPELSAEEHEALTKAALALQRIFLLAERQTLEEQYESLSMPLSIDQVGHLQRMGLDLEQEKQTPQPGDPSNPHSPTAQGADGR